MKRNFSLRLSMALLACASVSTMAFADPAVHGSIKLSGKELAHATPAQLARESKRLQHLAKITKQQAIDVARKLLKSRARVDKVILENEDGYLAYAIFLGGHEVLVDAGNGKVLGDEKESPNAKD